MKWFRGTHRLPDQDIQREDNKQIDDAIVLPSLQLTLDNFKDCLDLTHHTFPEINVNLVYFGHLVGSEELSRDVTIPLSNIRENEVQALLGRNQFKRTNDSKSLIKGILNGEAAIFHNDNTYLIDVYKPEGRSIQQSETETVITGPHDSFIEMATANLSLIRRRVKSSHLKVIKLEVGEVTKSTVYLLYIDGIANMDYLQELVDRINLIEIDAVHDGNMLIQYIDDCPNSVFPLFSTTERTDTAVSKLVAGRIVGILDGSPSVFSAPSSFFEFMASPDDYYQRWAVGTALRILRFIALIITLSFTALYVAVTTYHYEMIPEALLLTITESRSKVPFPPLYEALLMEVTIELLREAGARLPTKIGQTIGIVGGIVIGQAAVQAGFTSNILIIAVASSAIASFVIPSYVMSASIRLVRFGLIIMAGILGDFGIALGIAYLVVHLSGLTSLNSSYLTPVSPNNFKDWRDVFIRAPFWALTRRPTQSKSSNVVRNRMRK
ncbi:spore germination protein [Paenibacillus sp. CCS19]|uniref:spore germination protein n=1 Tax=Paenibacillus sp. CCS19 TaxID=3158387 RepID=UPI00256E20EF|nr:spore germination protein [Paenibacillus cellulosilyticus]GMK40624.1 spore germination protein [Paenibacillus cellulosilyticus]